LVINLTMFKIQLQNGEFFKNASGRIQHYRSNTKASAKIEKLGDAASGATVVESKAKKAAVEAEKLDESPTECKVVKIGKSKKAKAEKASEDMVATGKAKKAKKIKA
jgi:hypothetical protein